MLTHYHGDHACGAARIKEASRCDVYAPSSEAEAIRELAKLEVDALFPGHGIFCLENGGGHVKAAADRFATGLIPPRLYYFA